MRGPEWKEENLEHVMPWKPGQILQGERNNQLGHMLLRAQLRYGLMDGPRGYYAN